jgi:hypothetical protein
LHSPTQLGSVTKNEKPIEHCAKVCVVIAKKTTVNNVAVIDNKGVFTVNKFSFKALLSRCVKLAAN